MNHLSVGSKNADMMNNDNYNEDQADDTKKSYVFFSDPEIIAKKAEESAAASQNQQTSRFNESITGEDLKYSSSLLNHYRVQPYPFTFITAVKRKLALAAEHDSCKRASYKPDYNDRINQLRTGNIDSAPVQSLYEQVQKMEFTKPLKVPDLKISSKTLDFSPRDNSGQRNTSQKGDKASKNSEKAYRKLDFSQGSFIMDDELKALKAPDVSFGSCLTKKKEYSRDSSHEKENRMKRMKKDELSFTKSEEFAQETGKRAKNLKHIPKKDTVDFSIPKSSKNERLLSRDSDLIGRKSKSKNFTTSTSKKEEERRLRPTSSHSQKSSRDRSLESKGRTFSSESLSDRNTKIHDYVTVRENAWALEHSKKDKSKPSTSKAHNRLGGNTTDISEDIEIGSKSNTIESNSIYTELLSKNKNERLPQNTQSSSQSTKSSKIPENFRYIDSIRRKDTSASSQNVTPTEVRATSDVKFDTTDSTDELLLNPRKISFRDDSYTHQEDFCNLITPDLNLIYRPKRKKDQRPIQSFEEPEAEAKYKFYPSNEAQGGDNVPLLHPTALHMQFQAELHLFDSYNESIRQVTDVENSLYDVKQHQEREKLQLQKLSADQIKKQLIVSNIEESSNDRENNAITTGKLSDNVDTEINPENRHLDEERDSRKIVKSIVKVAEVQTQTANDIATQTDTPLTRHNVENRLKEFAGITYSRGGSFSDMPQLSLGSIEEFEDLDQLEEISLPNKMRAMSEISLHETTSSIKTETGTEISISTRDVTCSFNKFLDLEMAQLIKDEKQMYDKIEMLFKSREKTLNDRTRKLVKLEEQKRALRDTGQDSRISSVKKKQRALLLKLQHEKDEMNRLKELHKLASQERKLMLQKQRNMFNPQMSTKNILTKLKRTADCQSPRRLSGPMKGYDIRSNSSRSSHVDSDKSQLDRSHLDTNREISDSGSNQIIGKVPKSNAETVSSASGNIAGLKSNKYPNLLEESSNSSHMEFPQKYEVNARKFEEKMPKGADLLRLKAHQMEFESKLLRHGNIAKLTSQNSQDAKSESDTLVEELSKKSKGSRDRSESMIEDNLQKKKIDKSTISERDSSKKLVYNNPELKMISKRKSTKSLKPKSVSNVLHENILRSKADLHSADDILKHNRRSSAEKDGLQSEDNCHDSILEEISFNDSQNSLQALVKHSKSVKEKNYKLLRDIVHEHEAKENMARNRMDKGLDHNNTPREDDADVQNLGNISTRSQVSTFTISHHSSGDSEKSYSRSVVIRSQDHQFKSPKKLEQILHAREAALATRRNCVEDWIAWHTRLKAEESRVARMEEAALKLVSATSNVLSCHDTTASSDTSDVEGRVELLAEKLAERRAEMAKLKREARKQAKQRLKALEANLLNQIKKYDMTIDEMRKKLESKRSLSKDDGKLAIEAKSIADFKVPEIPIKRIQEICRNTDLFRSRSESDLITNDSYTDNRRNNSGPDYQSTSSLQSKDSSLKDSQAVNTASHSIESVLEEVKSFSSRKLVCKPSFLNINGSDDSDRTEKMSSFLSPSRSSNSQVQIRTEEQISNAPSVLVPTTSIYSKTVDKPQSSSAPEEMTSNEVVFSTKIDFLQLNNKNLSEDINTLENDLKTLSEMMSRFSKKSDEKLRSVYNNSASENEKSTSRDVSEDLSKSENIETIGDSAHVAEDLDHQQPSKLSPAPSEYISLSPIPQSSIQPQVSDVMTTVLPDTKSLDTKLPEEIDFEARSKEILNVIEKSIISEHIKLSGNNLDLTGAALEKSMQNLHKENEALSSDFNSLEGDIKSISEIISKMVESKRSLSLATDISQSVYTLGDRSMYSEENKIVNLKDQESEINEEADDIDTISQSQAIKNSSQQQRSENSRESLNADHSHVSTTVENEEIPDYSIVEDLTNTQDKIDNECSPRSHISQEKIVESNYSVLSDKEDDKIGNQHTTESISVGPTSSRNDWTISDSLEASHEVHENNEKLSLEPEEDATVGESHRVESFQEQETDFPNYTGDIEATMFVSAGESTNIHDAYGLSGLEETAIDETLNFQKIHTDELDDILDIIARESRETRQAACNVPGEVPDALQLEIRDNLIAPSNNELNLTAEVEPVLQKLTEILQSVERNIAKRTQNKELQSQSNEEKEKVKSVDDKKSLFTIDDLNIDEAKVSDDTEDQFAAEVAEEEATEPEITIPLVEEPQQFAELHFNTPDVLKDPEYEDISEESLEVSEILDRSESQRSTSQRSKTIPDKYEAIQRTDDVLRILDQISQQSSLKVGTKSNDHLQDLNITIQVYESLSPGDVNKQDSETGVVIEKVKTSENSRKIDEQRDEVLKRNEGASSESSEDADTPRGVSEIDMDSPRDPNESRLDIEILDDNLLTGGGVETNQNDPKLEFPPDASITTSEKDIEVMIDKLRESLGQPGLAVAELDARLLRLEQLQIELQIKKLETEEVAFYVREIPNKPPPPYTPPGGGSLFSPETSPTLPPAVVPTNVEELTAFTEKATVIIYNAKQAGKDVMSLEAPPEICQLSKDNNEITKKDKKIYNTFLFDLCKETIAEVYQSEYERPGPSWAKPNVKTKPAMNIPKTVDELNEYVSKEVATLFGFKTKLQRENMVMRWSRKRRDRVDELLAREAQAEEDEWTKFHHDELAVKNELTVAILDTLILETTNIVKSADAKKRRIRA